MSLVQIDPDRLYSQLQITGLAVKDPALFQLTKQIIDALKRLIVVANTSSSGGGSTTVINNTTMSLGGDGDGSAGEDGYPVPGPAGINGVTGSQGPQGVTLLANDGEDGIDGFNIPNPGPQGTTGAQGPLGVSILPFDGEDGQDGIGFPGPPGIDGSGAWTSIFKASNTSRNNNTITDDPDLIVPVLANSTYTIELLVFMTGETASDFRYCMAGPAGLAHVTNASYVINPNTTSGTFAVLETLPGSGTPVSVACATGQDGILHIFITVAVGATPGNVSFQWAQNSTQAGENAIVYAGSWLQYRKVA